MSDDRAAVPEPEPTNEHREGLRTAKDESSYTSDAALTPGSSQPEAAVNLPQSTRTSAAWVALLVGMLALIVVLVFILENLATVKIGFFGEHLKLPLAVALLLAAVLGGLVVFLLGSIRILQLRQAVRKHHGMHSAS